MSKIYMPLSDILSAPTSFTVVESVARPREDGSSRFIVKLRTQMPSEANGLKTEGSSMTLYVSTVEDATGEITIDPKLWEYTLSEFPHPETGEVLNLKWLRVAR